MKDEKNAAIYKRLSQRKFMRILILLLFFFFFFLSPIHTNPLVAHLKVYWSLCKVMNPLGALVTEDKRLHCAVTAHTEGDSSSPGFKPRVKGSKSVQDSRGHRSSVCATVCVSHCIMPTHETPYVSTQFSEEQMYPISFLLTICCRTAAVSILGVT